MKKIITIIIFICSLLNVKANNDSNDSLPSDSASTALSNLIAHLDSIINSFDYKKGTINLKDGLATINVPDSFSFLNAGDAQKLLTDLWENPKDETVLGMFVSDSHSLLSSDAWGVIVTYEEDGYVKDDDAADIKYDDLLKTMKEQSEVANAERVKEGYPEIHLTGWAREPFYDKKNHKLHWAKELQFGTDSSHTLNYNIRMLGRKGVLVLNIVSGMDMMPEVKKNVDKILASTDFNKGNRYEDFDSGIDKVAEYGIGGLIVGGILAKAGLFAKLGIILLKAWKFIALGVVGLFTILRKKILAKKDNEVRTLGPDDKR
ncbi:MAG: DUF2167 domain-containing protein [Bacteroidia bacterium]